MTNLQQNYPHEPKADLLAQQLPTISIVVPNYNNGATIGATLQSLVDQNYPKLEIIVVDGGSTDNSVEVIKQFEQHLTWWISEKDRGQSNAINKGFARCTGEIVNWLCSDDILTPGALHIVGKYFAESPGIDVLVGNCNVVFTHGKNRPLTRIGIIRSINALVGGSQVTFIDEDNQSLVRGANLKQINLIPVYSPIPQPSCFYRRRLLDRPQPVDESYYYLMDLELWSYFLSLGVTWCCIDEILSKAIQNGQNKPSLGGFKATLEAERLYKNYVHEWLPLTFWHRRLRYPLECFIKNHTSKIWLYLIAPVWLMITLVLALFYGFDRVWVMNWRNMAE